MMEGALVLSVTTHIYKNMVIVLHRIFRTHRTQGTTESYMEHIMASFTTVTLKYVTEVMTSKKVRKAGQVARNTMISNVYEIQ
jgi:hypothetical protein